MLFSCLAFLAFDALGNKFCTTSPCRTCTSGYNFLSISCLNFCPHGYNQSGLKCLPNESQDIFLINFSSFRKFESDTISTFSHPSRYKFNSDSIEAPISTLDRGFYFNTKSFLVSNTSWVLSPRFCFSIIKKI